MKHFINALLVAFIFMLGLNQNVYAQVQQIDQDAKQMIFKDGTYATTKIENTTFTGIAWMKNLIVPHEPSKIYSAQVTFEPGARTNWHSHAKGQSLIVTEGTGYVQEWGKEIQEIHAGDVIWCPPNVKHWHGATPNSMMTHIAISERSEQGTTWFEPVSDEIYFKHK